MPFKRFIVRSFSPFQRADLHKKTFRFVERSGLICRRRAGPAYGSEVILPKKFIPQVELDYIQTIAARLRATLDFLKNRVV